jgi:signal transduction histidine kinase
MRNAVLVTPDFLARKRVFQTAAWMWLLYLAALASVDAFIYHSNRPYTPILVYHLINDIPALLFLGISYSKWLENRASLAVPAMILLITATPILANYLFNLHLPPAPLSNLEGMVLRQLPVLLIGLVLVAWHYNLIAMIVYSLSTNLLEFVLVSLFGLLYGERLSDFSFIIIIRTVSFIVVGVFINQLIMHLRRQHESLMAANDRLTHYARTLEDLTISRERNRMSRELHDTVVHTLSGLSVQLETMKAYWQVDSKTARNLLDGSIQTTRSGLQETRRALKALRATPLDDLGLILALRNLINSASERGGFLTDVTLPDRNVVLTPDVEQCIYRITQEAVENVVQHANAHHLAFRLTVNEDEVLLEIQDDGTGFLPENGLPSGHFGLKGMQERAQLVGGRLTINSKPSHGTRIQLLIKGSHL